MEGDCALNQMSFEYMVDDSRSSCFQAVRSIDVIAKISVDIEGYLLGSDRLNLLLSVYYQVTNKIQLRIITLPIL